MSSNRTPGQAKTVDQPTRSALEAFHAVLASRYGPRLKAVYLFGSRARGDYRPDSDADVAIFVDSSGQTRAELLRDQVNLSGEAYDIWLETGIRIQPWVFSTEALLHPDRDHNTHLLRRILNEGVAA